MLQLGQSVKSEVPQNNRNMMAQSQYSKEREDFSNKLKQLRDKMNKDSNVQSLALSAEKAHGKYDRNAGEDDDDYFKIQSPVKRSNINGLTRNENQIADLQDTGGTTRLEESIN